jgi:lysophospholipase L1-like esterase
MSGNLRKAAMMAGLAVAPLSIGANRTVALAQMQQTDHWIGSWAAAPVRLDDPREQWPVSDVTLREIVHLSLGGSSIRIRLTNEYGTTPLYIASAHIALSANSDSIDPSTDHTLTFDGKSDVRIPAGAVTFSDPVKLSTASLCNLAVSLYLPAQPVVRPTYHDEAYQTNYTANGNTVAATSLEKARQVTSWYFLDGVDVQTDSVHAGTIVALGDSITDGAESTPNTNHRWTDFFAERLRSEAHDSRVAVVNEGIGGNRILHEHYGPSALARFDRDVLSQSGVKYLIILEGTNDIGHLVKPPVDIINEQQLEAALVQMAARAHKAGIKVYGGTMLPFAGATYYSARGEAIRERVNRWIRTSGVFDSVIDFDGVIRDPDAPRAILPRYDAGDHLHLTDAGYQAMSNAINLELFR